MALEKVASGITLPWPYNDDTFFKKFYTGFRHPSAAQLQSSDLPQPVVKMGERADDPRLEWELGKEEESPIESSLEVEEISTLCHLRGGELRTPRS